MNVDDRSLTLSPSQLAAVPAGTSPVDARGGPLADTVAVSPGHGAVVQALTEPGVNQGTVYLITDLGMKFPLSGPQVLASLGLSGVQPTPLPGALLQLLRTGPELDQQD